MNYRKLADEQLDLARKEEHLDFWDKLFGKKPDKYLISEYYEKAANFYLLDNDRVNAAHCFILAAPEKPRCYIRAADAYLFISDIESAIKILKRAIKFHKLNGNYDRLSMLYLKLAKLVDNASAELKYYNKAFGIEDTITVARKLAEKSAQIGDYDQTLKFCNYLNKHSPIIYRRHWLLANWLVENINFVKSELQNNPDQLVQDAIYGNPPVDTLDPILLELLKRVYDYTVSEYDKDEMIDFT